MKKNFTTFFYRTRHAASMSALCLLIFLGAYTDAFAQRISTEKTAASSLKDTWPLQNLALDIYPNPSRGNALSISVKGCQQKEATLILYNTIGSVVWQQDVEANERGEISATLNPKEDALPHGLYFLSITEKGQRTMKKIIIN